MFLALFGVGLYFMCHISVGLDQELALPKVSCAVACPPGVGRVCSTQQMGGLGQGSTGGAGPLPMWAKGEGLITNPRPREADGQASGGGM